MKRMMAVAAVALVMGGGAIAGAGSAVAERPFNWDGPYDSLVDCDTTRVNDPAAMGVCSYRTVAGLTGWYYPARNPF